MAFGILESMKRDLLDSIALILLSSFLIGVMVVAGYLLIVSIPAFARFLFTIWYVLAV